MSSFDTSWTTGPHGPFPFLLLSQTDIASERAYVLGGVVGANVFQVAGAIVQYSIASVTAPPRFRRTLTARLGSRGVASQ